MSGLGAWIWGTSQLDDAVDRATSELLPAGGEEIALNLEICDQIRSKSVPAKDAMRALKRRLNHKNPNVQLLALSNGGDLFLAEVASREFMDNLVSILKMPALNHDVKQTILRLVQNWSVAFEGKPTLNYVGQVYKTLTNEGYKFPPKDLAVANSAMVDTQTAPEWIDSEVCLRCRTPFSFTNRKHHCRNCGQVFDQACSSKTMTLPHFGITQEVRVCDGCHSKLTRRLKGRHRHSVSHHGHRHKSARELADAELQRAIQLSLEEVNGTSGQSRPGYVPSQPSPSNTYPDRKAAVASLREASAPKPSAPVVVETPRSEEPSYSYAGPGYSQSRRHPNFQPDCGAGTSARRQGLSRYPAVTELYDKASGLRPKMALSLDDAGRKEQMLSDMHDKLSQAVKLYDQILTQQVAHPRWRTPTSPASYQQEQPAYNQGYAPNGYSQWAPQQPNQTGSKGALSPRVPYAPPGLTSTPETSQAQQYQQLQQQPYQQQAQPQQPQYAPASIPVAPQMTTSRLLHLYITTIRPTAVPATILDSNGHTHPPTALLSLRRRHHNTNHLLLRFRYATITCDESRPTELCSVFSLCSARRTFVQYLCPTQRQQYQAPPPGQQQPYQVASPPPAPAALPQFPSAPTSVPQPAFSAYASGFEQKEERKEALLIDL
ncbi:hypothetical protein BDZ97DRAFT_1901128 [Flammula alnicola]|nr:hypothetical protein BDZ97DRAFT_1901128 [Flammula alnicola]